MYCTDFEYANEKLSDYGMIICSFNGSGGSESVPSGAEIKFSQAKPSMGNRFNLYSSNYEEPFTAVFQIGKDPKAASSADEMYLSTVELSSVQRWLCRKNRYYKFKISQPGYEHIYWNATFESKQINLNGRIVGIEATMHTDAPYGYMDNITIEKDCSKALSFDVYDSSDEVGHIYPDMEISFLENGNFMLTNTMSENKTTRISNCESGETIKFDGKNQIITTSSKTHILSN
ncbi:MAG: hypothetical protein K2L37_00425, partial [Lactobacillus sp.]|nr:hypothetical protein [Lactobacillus sp.]